ncbi:MAG: hypothetical protein KF745_09515 [Phycisphaeraceae bacterium]|nr:hypothetical protein [Phycisphaeraceae bacterium]
MKTRCGLVRGLLCGVGLCTGLSFAVQAAPPVFDRVPTDALIVVAAPSLDRVNKSMEFLKASIEAAAAMPSPADALKMGGIEKGLDTTKPFAIIGMADPADAAKKDAADDMDFDDDEPKNFVILVPTSDYKALLSNFGAEPGAAGSIDTVRVPDQDQDVYLKSIGDGYAAMSPTRDILEKFSGKAGNLKAFEAAMGKTCNAISDAADMVFYANIPAIKAQPGPTVSERLQSAMEMSPLGMMGGGGDMDGMGQSVDAFMDQAQAAVIGMKIDALGVSIDSAAQFKEGSDYAKTFSKPGDAGTLIKKLPKQDYLFAFAADLSDPQIKSTLRKWGEMNDADKGMPNMAGIQVDDVDGAAFEMGFSPAMLAPGAFFSGAVAYLKANPDAYLEKFQTAITELNGKTINGFQMATTFGPPKSNPVVNGAAVNAWAVKMTPDEDADDGGESAMMMQVLFGPAGGPSGLIAKADGGVIQTMSKNSTLLSAALDAAKGQNSLAADTLMGQVAEKLPTGRFIEGYLGAKTILEMAKIPLAQFVGEIDVEIPDTLPPVGLAAAGNGGAARATVYVPMIVIKTAGEMVKAMNRAGGDGDMDMDEGDHGGMHDAG